MPNTSNAERPNAPIFINLRSATRGRSIAQQSADTAYTRAEPAGFKNAPQSFEELPRIMRGELSTYAFRRG